MDQKILYDVFQKAFTEVTLMLTKIPLQGTVNGTVDECKEQIMLFTSGFIEAEIVCLFATELCQAIVKAMHGGTMPVEQERILYLKEYMNIVCGRAVSVLNNEMGKSSRLSVPYYQEEAPKRYEDHKQEIRFYYETDFGAMQVRIGLSA